MKRVISFIILVVALSAITYFTVYTLNNREVREVVEQKVTEKIELVTSNISNNILSEIYNVYLNGQKHKLKFEYTVTFYNDKLAKADLVVFFDGQSILSNMVARGITATDVKGFFDNINVINYVRLNKSNIQIIDEGKIHCVILKVKYFDDNAKEKYYLLDSDGKMLINKGLLIKDESVSYVNENDEELTIFYDYESQIMAKIEDDTIYALILSKDKDKFEEYKYYFVNGKLKKDLLNSYVNIKIRENTTKSE